MLATRVIPVLLIKNRGLVKTIKFDKSRYIGDPVNAVKIFNDKEVDEIVIFDIEASKNNTKPDFEFLTSIASECFIPLSYGGGVESLEDMSRLFDLGVEKVILNSSILKNLDLVSAASKIFGAQSVVVCIDFKKNIWGKYSLFSHINEKINGEDIFEFIQKIEKAGAGELILQSVDRDGTYLGFDLNFIRQVSHNTSIPVVACGGAGCLDDFKLAHNAGASAVAAGSLFVYHGTHKAVLINYPSSSIIKSTFSNA